MVENDLGEYGFFVDGEYRQADGGTFDVLDPATNEPVAFVAECEREDVAAAVDSATAASEEWASYDPSERGRLLRSIADAIRDSADELARIESIETGRPLSLSKGVVRGTASTFEYHAGLTDKIEGQTIPLSDHHLDYTRREPLGVTAHVVPWNVPTKLMARSVAPALACGNTAVVKPSPEAPVAVLELCRIMAESGLPPGVLNAVPGGVETGKLVTDSDAVAGITFTGSLRGGREVGKAAAEKVVPATLELGGKSPYVVFDDADVDRAVDEVTEVFTTMSGQVCYATTRLFVHEDVYDEYISKLVDKLEAVEMGHWADDPDMGPLISAEAKERVTQYVDEAVADGATVLTGGDGPDREGNFYLPTLLEDVPNDAPLACDEVFGPVATVSSFASKAEAVRRANDTKYGLYAAIWTNDLTRAHSVAHDIEAGTVSVNEYAPTAPQAPVGGYKKSGIGREKHKQAIEHYTQLKNVVINLE
jgi:aldehyde dehydrogenase (NAD+)